MAVVVFKLGVEPVYNILMSVDKYTLRNQFALIKNSYVLEMILTFDDFINENM